MPLSSLILAALFIAAVSVSASAVNRNGSSSLPGIEFPDHTSFNAAATDCSQSQQQQQNEEENPAPLKLHLRRRRRAESEPRGSSVVASTARDSSRIQILHRRIAENKNNRSSESRNHQPRSSLSGEEQMIATVESGVGFGSGEYFMDVFIGTPPRRFSMILDTGSDLNWIQCEPCHDCFDQAGPVYDPAGSSSYRNITCGDPRCGLVSPPEPHRPCRSPSDPCPYYYWYGDSSNTTGDFALEAFTVNVTSSGEARRVEGVMFGCGHWNRGLFRGAAGLLGLGRGPLSFSSQLQSLYGGRSFSYCLVDRDSNVTSKLVFGAEAEAKHENDHNSRLNFTALVSAAADTTFYYVDVKTALVGGEALPVPEDTWRLSRDGSGGTIVDSGTTLSYFAEPAYRAIEEAFVRKVGERYERAVIEDFPLEVCYNVSGVEDEVELPEFGIVFADGAVWDFPVENYFIEVEPQKVVCLAFKKTSGAMNIIGNYQQQNFHILYDTKNSRLGYAPANCAEL